MGTCPVCSSRLSWRARFRARFAPVDCPGCATALRANATNALVLLYTLLTVAMFLGVLWSTRVGCAVPLAVFVVGWVGGELFAGVVSPLRRAE